MRLDVYLVESGHAKSREAAKRMIEEGCVLVDGVVVRKSAYSVDESFADRIEAKDPLAYVGRGGLKLEAALAAFGLDVRGMTALDVGASTGGFTDCLLQKGAEKVFALDAGRDQLDPSLRTDPRVVSMEGQNARAMTPELFGGTLMDLIVMDVSFISATYLIPLFDSLLKEGGCAIVLVKPQFEVGKTALGKKGIVKDPKARLSALEKVLAFAEASGLSILGVIRSPILGGDGNHEFLALFCKEKPQQNRLTDAELRRVVWQ